MLKGNFASDLVRKRLGLVYLTTLLAVAAVNPAMGDGQPVVVGHVVQYISIESAGGAKCVLTQDGKVVARMQLSSSYVGNSAISQAKIDVEVSHDDIFATCAKPGYVGRTARIPWMSIEVTSISAPCIAPPEVTRAEYDACNSRQNTGGRREGYPQLFPIPMKRKGEK